MAAIKIFGQDIGPTGTCRHYHSDVDVVALRCEKCQQYFACYQCHDAMRKHAFQPAARQVGRPVLCGVCHKTLTYAEYKETACPYCGAAFNPNCVLHQDRYFQD
ncbi:CHY zinc finger protein [Fructobacillus sp. M1-13]|uniref:CHY zinc finger protein n=1 Tax=Fructobacillus papyriferae TaxID=2713171 RepID=UPI001BD62A39|nr:CHY zinc finger protein [Fructobacillus papyriferae]MCD2159115.1 CHY zinc finger protein [Fructobacillus papyriferae]